MQANHILAKEGILTSFAIAKKVTEKDIKKLRKKLNVDSLNEDEIDDLLKEAIIDDTEKSLLTDEIPGLILEGIDVEVEEEKKKITELTFFSSIIAKKMKEKQIDKYHSCYIINAIVNMLGLTEEDFDEFHKKFRNGQRDDGYEDFGNDDEESGDLLD